VPVIISGFADGFGVHGTPIFRATAIGAAPAIALSAAVTCGVYA